MSQRRSGEDKDSDHMSPSVADLMCGKHTPVATALQWCGWRVHMALDRQIDASHDLRNPDLRASLIKAVPDVDAWFISATRAEAEEANE
eukprot:10006981-Heterocapsa_arctica.AAC.1